MSTEMILLMGREECKFRSIYLQPRTDAEQCEDDSLVPIRKMPHNGGQFELLMRVAKQRDERDWCNFVLVATFRHLEMWPATRGWCSYFWAG